MKIQLLNRRTRTVVKGLPLLLLGTVFFLLSGCKKDDLPQSLMGGSYDATMSFEAETTVLISPINPNEVSELTDLDKSLSLPTRDRRKEIIGINADGTYYHEVEVLTPSDPIIYPPNTINKPLPTPYKKKVNVNGKITLYNDEGEVITPGVSLLSKDEIISTAEMFLKLKDFGTPTDEQFDAYINFLSDNGLHHTEHNGDTYTVKIDNNTVNGSSILVIDKKACMQVGQLDFDARGRGTGFYMLKVSGRAPDVTLHSLTQVSYFDAIDAPIRMKKQEITLFRNFSLTF